MKVCQCLTENTGTYFFYKNYQTNEKVLWEIILLYTYYELWTQVKERHLLIRNNLIILLHTDNKILKNRQLLNFYIDKKICKFSK